MKYQCISTFFILSEYPSLKSKQGSAAFFTCLLINMAKIINHPPFMIRCLATSQPNCFPSALFMEVPIRNIRRDKSNKLILRIAMI